MSDVWIIPEDTKKPDNEHAASVISDNALLPFTELCRELSISEATGRNWIKLGKLLPSLTLGTTPYFTAEYAGHLRARLESSDTPVLKSRRNKHFVSGNGICRAYVSAHSVNVPAVRKILDLLRAEKIEATDSLIRILVSECAIQLLCQKLFPIENETNESATNGSSANKIAANYLESYLSGSLRLGGYDFLITDLLPDKDSALAVLDANPELFSVEYVYEEKEDILGFLYLSLKNLGSRKAAGSYYTPTNVVKKLCSRLFDTTSATGKTVFDPCCGTGNFLLQLPHNIPFSNIYGNDIDKISVRITRINMALKYKITNQDFLYNHITESDYLFTDSAANYDFIIGNPPWGYHYTKTEKEQLRKKYISASGAAIESYDVFIERAISDLTLGGVLSFVLPEAFLNVKAHTQTRTAVMRTNSFRYLEFLGNVFDKVQCPCIILQIVHDNTPFTAIGLTVNDGKRTYTISTEREVTADCFVFSATDAEYAVLKKIANLKNAATLENNAVFALGIVTGSNQTYISDQKTAENEMVLKGSDIYKYRFRNTNNYIVFQPGAFQQTAPEKYYRAPEKLLYRFICNQPVFAYDNRQTLSLNSCNILIPAIDGLNIKYIMAILNSGVSRFFFRKMFHSVKILRSHLERLPIPQIEEDAQKPVIDMVNALLGTSDPSSIHALYDALDLIIADLYHISEDEYKIIKASMDGENLFLY